MHPPIAWAHSGCQRNSQHHRGASSVVRIDQEFAAQCFGACPHACESLAFAYPVWIEAWTIVQNFERKPSVFELQVDLRLRALRMPRDIVDGLLENEKDLAAQVCSNFQSLVLSGRGKAKLNLSGSEQVAGEATHAVYEIAKMILVRIYGPYDVTHGIHQVAGSAGDNRKRFADPRFYIRLMACHFTQNRYPRQARTDV